MTSIIQEVLINSEDRVRGTSSDFTIKLANNERLSDQFDTVAVSQISIKGVSSASINATNNILYFDSSSSLYLYDMASTTLTDLGYSDYEAASVHFTFPEGIYDQNSFTTEVNRAKPYADISVFNKPSIVGNPNADFNLFYKTVITSDNNKFYFDVLYTSVVARYTPSPEPTFEDYTRRLVKQNIMYEIPEGTYTLSEINEALRTGKRNWGMSTNNKYPLTPASPNYILLQGPNYLLNAEIQVYPRLEYDEETKRYTVFMEADTTDTASDTDLFRQEYVATYNQNSIFSVKYQSNLVGQYLESPPGAGTHLVMHIIPSYIGGEDSEQAEDNFNTLIGFSGDANKKYHETTTINWIHESSPNSQNLTVKVRDFSIPAQEYEFTLFPKIFDVNVRNLVPLFPQAPGEDYTPASYTGTSVSIEFPAVSLPLTFPTTLNISPYMTIDSAGKVNLGIQQYTHDETIDYSFRQGEFVVNNQVALYYASDALGNYDSTYVFDPNADPATQPLPSYYGIIVLTLWPSYESPLTPLLRSTNKTLGFYGLSDEPYYSGIVEYNVTSTPLTLSDSFLSTNSISFNVPKICDSSAPNLTQSPETGNAAAYIGRSPLAITQPGLTWALCSNLVRRPMLTTKNELQQALCIVPCNNSGAYTFTEFTYDHDYEIDPSTRYEMTFQFRNLMGQLINLDGEVCILLRFKKFTNTEPDIKRQRIN